MSESANLNTINKIKKLLAVAATGSGATEGEAMSAAALASALMLKHNIDVQLDDDKDEPTAQRGESLGGYDEPWHIECSGGAGYLYSCRPLIQRRMGNIAFVGRPDNINAAEMTLKFFVDETERLYKLNLPKGLSKLDRANFRATFKMACARRIAARCWAIMETLRQDDAKAIEATGSRALVIVQSIDAMLAEADAMLGDAKKLPVRKMRFGLGTDAGRAAGDKVELQKKVS